jgi:NAD(P)H-nitrite reductase large subunit
MKHITVIGAGESGLAFIDRIRENNSKCAITLLDKNTHHFSKATLMANPMDITQRVELNEWTKSREVEFINDTVERINPRRRKIYCKQNEVKDFEVLVVAAGLTSRDISIKGDHRDGFFYISRIDPFKLRDLLSISSEVAIYVSTLLGLKISLAIRTLGKEVRLVSKDLNFLREDKEKVLETLKERGIILHLDSLIEEAVGEATVKATKISPLKAFASQVVLVDSGFSANRRLFEEDLVTCDIFFTNFDEVYLLGDITREDIENDYFFDFNPSEAKEQASILADYLLKAKAPIFQKRIVSWDERKKVIANLLEGNPKGSVKSIPSS